MRAAGRDEGGVGDVWFHGAVFGGWGGVVDVSAAVGGADDVD